MLVFLSLYVTLSIRLSILVCAAASLFCACLVSVQVSEPYVIAGSTQELYTCFFRQMARLLLKISRCLAYVTQPAMILRSCPCGCSVVPSTHSLKYFLSAHCSRLGVVCNHQVCQSCDVHLNRLAPDRPQSTGKITSYFPSRPMTADSPVGSLKYFS